MPPAGPETTRRRVAGERELILQCAASICATEGYAALSVERVRDVGGIPSRRLGAHFDGCEDCFLAAIDLLSEDCVAAVRRAYEDQTDWPRGIHAALNALCAWLDNQREFACLVLIEIFSAGPVAMDWRSQKIARLANFLHSSLPPARRPSALAAEASVAGIWALLASRIVEDPKASLLPLVPTLSFVLLAPAIGPKSAAAHIEAQRGREDRSPDGAQYRPAGGPGSEGAGSRGRKEPVPGC
jgi:hypothetical protein